MSVCVCVCLSFACLVSVLGIQCVVEELVFCRVAALEEPALD